MMNELHKWGIAYAQILEKITKHYRDPDKKAVKRILNAAITGHLPEHLRSLIDSYKTTDEMAGVHLGCDQLGGKTIEWNLGAVGGLEEGLLAARQFAGRKLRGEPFERDASDSFARALLHAYYCHCRARNISPSMRPVVACVEHDDIYGSTASICDKLKKLGFTAELCFHQELEFHDSRLRLMNGTEIDILYMDCHLENLKEDHPILRALKGNLVTLDGSPFARLVLRSKVIMGLLHDQVFTREIGLCQAEKIMVEKHLAKTWLWCKKVFRNNPELSQVKEDITEEIKNPGTRPRGEDCAGLVFKIGIGPVYGGSSVSVLAPGSPGLGKTAKLIREYSESPALSNTAIKPAEIFTGIFHPLKGLLREIILSRLPAPYLKFNQRCRRLWNEYEGSSAISFIRDKQEDIWKDTGVTAGEPVICQDKKYLHLVRSLKKMSNFSTSGEKDKNTLHMIRHISLFTSTYLYQRKNGGKLIEEMMRNIKTGCPMGRKINFKESMALILSEADKMLRKFDNSRLSEKEQSKIAETVKPVFLDKHLNSVCPIIIQPYIKPEELENESGLFLCHRVHALITERGKETFISGSQVYYEKEFKPDNRSKMTGSLWKQGRSM